jgi:hypothetical protein
VILHKKYAGWDENDFSIYAYNAFGDNKTPFRDLKKSGAYKHHFSVGARPGKLQTHRTDTAGVQAFSARRYKRAPALEEEDAEEEEPDASGLDRATSEATARLLSKTLPGGITRQNLLDVRKPGRTGAEAEDNMLQERLVSSAVAEAEQQLRSGLGRGGSVPFAFATVNQFCLAFLYGRAGRVTS